MSGIRGLRHIKTACGQRSIPPDSSRYSMRSHVSSRDSGDSGDSGGGGSGGRGMGGGMAKAQGPNKSPFKLRVTVPSFRSSLLCVQKFCEPVSELSREGDCINVRIAFPPEAAAAVEIIVQGGILFVQAETDDTWYCTECLLPSKAEVIDHSYSDGILSINLKVKES